MEMADKGHDIVKGLGNRQRGIRKKISLLELEKQRDDRNVQFSMGNSLNLHEHLHLKLGVDHPDKLSKQDSMQASKDAFLKHQTFQAKASSHHERLVSLEQKLVQVTHRISKIIRLPAEYRFLAAECVNSELNGHKARFCPFQEVTVDGKSAGVYSSWNRVKDTMLLNNGDECASTKLKTHVA